MKMKTQKSKVAGNGQQALVGSSADGMGAYCKCGKIIYAVTFEHLKNDTEAQHELINYIANGYRVEKVSKEQVRESFGCDCR
jgi:hypothetical protein